MVKLIPGKTNLIGYLDLDGNPIGEGTPDGLIVPGGSSFTKSLKIWQDMDDTSAWVIKDKKVVGKLDWSIGLDGIPSLCDFDKDDLHLNWIHMFDRGKGYATSALKQKHKDWKAKGYKSVTLKPAFSLEHTRPKKGLGMGQKKLYSWYNDLGYKKSNLCAHDDECDELFNCLLTKYL